MFQSFPSPEFVTSLKPPVPEKTAPWSLALLLAVLLCAMACSSLPMTTQDEEFQEDYDEDFVYSGLKVVKQSDPFSCGAACLSAVLQWHGVPEERAREDVILENQELSPQGYFIKELQEIALKYDMNAYAVLADQIEMTPLELLDTQINSGRPLICALKFPISWYFAYKVPLYGMTYRALLWWMGPRKNHFVVAFGINDDKDEILFMDPERGYATLPWSKFEKCWRELQYATLICFPQN